jgi:hypothetical protein
MLPTRSFGRLILVFAFSVMALKSARLHADEALNQLETERLLNGIRPLVSCLLGKESSFQVTAKSQFPIDGNEQQVDLKLTRFDKQSFDLSVTHKELQFELRRREDQTALAVPQHSVVFIGSGTVSDADSLMPENLSLRLTSPGSDLMMISSFVTMLSLGDIDTTVQGLLQGAGLRYESDADRWSIKDGAATIQTGSEGALKVVVGDINVTVNTSLSTDAPLPADQWPGMKTVELNRDELERTLLRGVRRAFEIARPSALLTKPSQKVRTVTNGKLMWVDGQRVALLQGTPEEIGTAHGQLLPEESRRCMESVLYTFGAVNSIRTGRWFRHDLVAAYARLAPYIPERHKKETRALAVALNMDPELVEVLNVFPELFHCSGFAAFGTATKDGKMYHGRVLDYMTTIGLQDAATTFIVRADGQIPFVNVGYGGFIGSVSGMNTESISLGEMGGRGEGQWDGVPMATLMRRAMEECHTLDDVKKLWSESPRTCHYYYVFADGKTNRAVGVSATPEKIEFIEPGQSHELLGEGIPDTVVLSAGSRLEELRRRVKEKHGAIDAEAGMFLMSRPVAMESNLHNVLFIPQDGVLYVANATHTKPAAEAGYVKLNLHELLRSPIPFGEKTAQRP